MIILGIKKSIELQKVDELDTIMGKIEILEKSKNICNVYMKKISDYANHINSDSSQNESEFQTTLLSLKNVCDNVILNLQELNNLKKALYGLDNVSGESLKESIDKYNNTSSELFQKIDKDNAQMQDFTASVLKDYSFMFSTTGTQLPENTPVIKHDKASVNPLDNNTLVVSEKEQMAYLPYKYDDVQAYLNSGKRNQNKFATSQEVIDNIYTVPLSLFKFPTIARFREVFNLIRKEEGLYSAFETAVECMTNWSLDPIVVRACRDVQEFDIFADCLEENELEKFPCFKIEYKVAPSVKKHSKNEEFFE